MVRQTAEGNYHVVCTPSVQPVPVNELFELEVRVYTDAALSQPASNVAVGVDADMPAHRHGMTLMPRVAPMRASPGAFRATGMLLHMPGEWEIYIDVRETGRTERAKFEIEI